MALGSRDPAYEPQIPLDDPMMRELVALKVLERRQGLSKGQAARYREIEHELDGMAQNNWEKAARYWDDARYYAIRQVQGSPAWERPTLPPRVQPAPLEAPAKAEPKPRKGAAPPLPLDQREALAAYSAERAKARANRIAAKKTPPTIDRNAVANIPRLEMEPGASPTKAPMSWDEAAREWAAKNQAQAAELQNLVDIRKRLKAQGDDLTPVSAPRCGQYSCGVTRTVDT
jgi:hypothetical protein